MSDNDYVQPPKKNDDTYVKPNNTSAEYVASPKFTTTSADETYVQPPKTTYVKPTPNANINGYRTDQDTVQIIKDDDPYVAPSYFSTPKVGFI